MTIDEAIKHCEEVMMENLEKTKDRNASDPIAKNCFECADEHRQLAEWLKELKAYREQSGDAISRKYILDLIDTKGANLDDDLLIVEQWIQDAPSVNSQSIKCDDAISRREALNAITMAEVRWQAVDNVNKLPSVTPQQRTGRWIEQTDDYYGDISYRCSACNEVFCLSDGTLAEYEYCYCPNCGAKMEVENAD